MNLKSSLRPALVLFTGLTLLTGLVYPLVVTGLGQVMFPAAANGSLVQSDGKTLGSGLIGQSFTRPVYFWSRPSATGPEPYNAAASSGSNLGPNHPDLRKAVAERVAALRAADPGNLRRVPVDLVTTSASGLDPHISLAAAEYQLGRVARLRGVPELQLRNLLGGLATQTVWGEARVNVLALNMALDRQYPVRSQPSDATPRT